jgi:ribosomal protein L13
VKYTTSANRQSNNQSKRTNLCKVIIKKAIREFLPNTERGRDIANTYYAGGISVC